MATTIASRKAKGRTLQNIIRKRMLELAVYLKDDDIRSTPMGCTGADIMLSPLAQQWFPLHVECKNQEKVNVWAAYDQAIAGHNKVGVNPVVIIKKNRTSPLAVVNADYLLRLVYAASLNRFESGGLDDYEVKK